MANDVGALWRLADMIATDKRRGTSTVATIHHVDDEGVTWVVPVGTDEPVPVNGTRVASAEPGDVVAVSIADGRLSILGNATSPSVGGTYVQQAMAPVEEKADTAMLDAGQARSAANRAEDEAARAHDAADEAQAEAGRAHEAADAAQTSADMAHAAALAAQSDANDAHDAAVDAKNSATRANTAANDALVQLSNVQDVIGTVTWLAEHGTYRLTTDMTVDPDKTYYVRIVPMDGLLADHLGNPIVTSDGDYVAIASMAHSDGYLYLPVAEPTDAGLSRYYELTVDEAMSRYVASHLALTSQGLWVLKDDTAYKVLVAADGVSIYDPSGHMVVTYGEAIRFDSERPQYIGGEYAYIIYYDSDDDGKPDSIRIGGKNVHIGDDGRTLSEVLGDVSTARQEAASAVQTAQDLPVCDVGSTNGTTFKQNIGLSSTAVARIFTAGGVIDNAQKLHERYGAGAYLQWGWRDVKNGIDHVLLSNDPRIIMDGFGLVIGPEDVNVQARFFFELYY